MEVSEFKTRFLVDPSPCMIKVDESITSDFTIKKQHPFNIGNKQIIENGEITSEGKIYSYLNEVLFLFIDGLIPSKIEQFLNYHLDNATNKDGLISFIKYDIWDLLSNPPMILKPNRKEIILRWVQEREVKEPQKDTQPGTLSIDQVIRSMFPFIVEYEFNALKKNLSGGIIHSPLEYMGAKTKLWTDLGKLCNLGIDRKEIARVFSEYVRWKKTHTSTPKELKENEIYRKLDKMGTK
jgi:hypothetical protein